MGKVRAGKERTSESSSPAPVTRNNARAADASDRAATGRDEIARPGTRVHQIHDGRVLSRVDLGQLKVGKFSARGDIEELDRPPIVGEEEDSCSIRRDRDDPRVGRQDASAARAVDGEDIEFLPFADPVDEEGTSRPSVDDVVRGLGGPGLGRRPERGADDDVAAVGDVRPVVALRSLHVRDRPVGTPSDGVGTVGEGGIVAGLQIEETDRRRPHRFARLDAHLRPGLLRVEGDEVGPGVVGDEPAVGRRDRGGGEVAREGGPDLVTERDRPLSGADHRVIRDEREGWRRRPALEDRDLPAGARVKVPFGLSDRSVPGAAAGGGEGEDEGERRHRASE
jgi:hypothetical protein